MRDDESDLDSGADVKQSASALEAPVRVRRTCQVCGAPLVLGQRKVCVGACQVTRQTQLQRLRRARRRV